MENGPPRNSGRLSLARWCAQSVRTRSPLTGRPVSGTSRSNKPAKNPNPSQDGPNATSRSFIGTQNRAPRKTEWSRRACSGTSQRGCVCRDGQRVGPRGRSPGGAASRCAIGPGRAPTGPTTCSNAAASSPMSAWRRSGPLIPATASRGGGVIGSAPSMPIANRCPHRRMFEDRRVFDDSLSRR
jgi:hypothetical protein